MGINGDTIQFHLVHDFYIFLELNLIYPFCHTVDKAVVARPDKIEEPGTFSSRRWKCIFVSFIRGPSAYILTLIWVLVGVQGFQENVLLSMISMNVSVKIIHIIRRL